MMKLYLSYLAIFAVMLSALALFPKTGGYIWQAEIINPLSALLFTLLVYLTGRIAHSAQSVTGILCTALFILLFCPDSRHFFNRDETAVVELSSTCIVPFFISQYTRISNKNFKYGYFLMLLMGIFCSYTHDSITIPLGGHAASAYLLMAGSTNHMQSRIENALVVAAYADGTADTLRLVNPDNWCPIEQDYFVDGMAFHTTAPRPIRIAFGTGTVSRDLGREFCMDEVYGRPIPGGAAQMLRMPLDAAKELRSLTLRTLSNDVVVGLMAVTLQ